MSRTCESCSRSWRGSATFCGGCGDLLPDAMAGTEVPTPGRGSARRGLVLAVVLGVAVLAGAATVPSLTVERTPPVTGEVGVPETDDLQAAPAGTAPRRAVPGPEVSCSRGDEPVDCVVWERDLLAPPGPDGQQGWPVASGDHLLLTGPDGVEGVDARTGTRLWEHDDPTHPVPRDVAGDVAVLEGPGGVSVVDLGTGVVRWESPRADGVVQGDVLHDDLVLTLDDDGGATVVARDVEDGAPRWRWTARWPWVQAYGAVGDRLLLAPATEDPGLAIVDRRTGAEVARSDVQTSWWVLGAADDTVVLAEPIEERTGEGHGPAGDGRAMLRGVSLDDATIRWERPVAAGQVRFGLVDGVVLVPSTSPGAITAFDAVTAFDAATGQVAWERGLEPTEELGHHRPGGFGTAPDWTRTPQVVVTSDHADGLVRGHDPRTGDVRWERPMVGQVMHVGADADVVWVGFEHGFALLAPDTGQERLRVHGTGITPISPDPLLVFHHESGTVLRLAAGHVDGGG